MKIDLTTQEALVLFEWICTNSKCDEFFQDKSEQLVLWSIECQLEKELTAPHSEDYLAALTDARNTVKRKYGGEQI